MPGGVKAIMGVTELIGLALPGRYLLMVRQLLREHCPGAEVWAYGSRVAGGEHAASDLDLVVRRPESLNSATPEVSRLRAAFVESNLPIRVDILDWARIPASFQEEIMRGHVIVQEPER